MMEHPSDLSVRQIKLLELLKNLQESGDECTPEKVSDASGISPGLVSRFMKSCADCGYLDRQNCLTDAGLLLLKRQRGFMDHVEDYVRCLGLEGERLEESVKNLVENVDTPLLNLIMERERRRQRFDQIWGCQRGGNEVPAKTVKELIPYGRYEVEFRLFRLSGEDGLSMGDSGFVKPACLKKTRSGIWLELQRKEMQAPSGRDGQMMTGRLDSLRYEADSILEDAPLKGNTLRIPLDAFRFVGENQSEFIGKLHVTVTCSVGSEHMPERTAMLVIWI